MSRPMGLSSLRRWDRVRQRAVLPQPVKTRQHAPFGRVLVIAVVIAVGIWSLNYFTTKAAQVAALPGASAEIEAAYQKGLAQASKPVPCGINEFLGAKK